MRKVLIFLALSVLFFGLLSFMLNNLEIMSQEQLEIFKNDFGIQDYDSFLLVFEQIKQRGISFNYINVNNFFALISVFTLGLQTTLCSVHLFVDKLFFKTFYQQPNLSLALRRSIVVSLFFGLWVTLRVLAIANIWITLSLIVIASLIEYSFIYYSRTVRISKINNKNNEQLECKST
jgi:hypothetical protein